MGWYDDEVGPLEDKLPQDIECYYDEGKPGYIIGTPICQCEDWGLVNKEMEQTEISEVFFQVSRKLPNRPIKLLMGTRPT